MTTIGVTHAASLWYPVMLAQESGEISESKGAELLGMNILQYRAAKHDAITTVMRLVNELPSPLISLLDVLLEKPELFARIISASKSNGKAGQNESASAPQT